MSVEPGHETHDPELRALQIHYLALARVGQFPDASDWRKLTEAVMVTARRLDVKVAELEREVEDFDHSFTLYDNAIRLLTAAYRAANNIPEHIWPDTTQVSRWAAERLTEYFEFAVHCREKHSLPDICCPEIPDAKL
jgi:hypothetical protein